MWKIDRRNIGIRNKRRERTEHKGRRWRRTIATKDSILAENGRRNNAESIEVGLATPLASRRSSVVRATQSNAKLNSLYFPERRISKSSLVSRCTPPALPRHARNRRCVFRSILRAVFFFSLPLPHVSSRSIPSSSSDLVALNASYRKGARNYLRFIANIAVPPNEALPAAAFVCLYLLHPFLPVDK